MNRKREPLPESLREKRLRHDEMMLAKFEAMTPDFVAEGDGVNHHKRLQKLRRRIAKLRGSHTKEEWEALVQETGGICVRCGYQHDLINEFPVKGHIVSIARGGSDAIDNLQPLCRFCKCAPPSGEDFLAMWRNRKKGSQG